MEPATRQAEACVGPLDRVQPHRRQVWDTWQEVQQLETEIRDTMVSTITTSAIERCIRDTKVRGNPAAPCTWVSVHRCVSVCVHVGV